MSLGRTLGLLAGVLCACSDPCEDNCEGFKQCSPSNASIDCAQSCAASADLADLFGCREQLDAATLCEQDVTDKCTMFDACADAIAVYDACVADACAANPELCGGEPIGGGGS